MDKKEIEKAAYKAWEIEKMPNSTQRERLMFIKGFTTSALYQHKEVEPKKEVDLEELSDEKIKSAIDKLDTYWVSVSNSKIVFERGALWFRDIVLPHLQKPTKD